MPTSGHRRRASEAKGYEIPWAKPYVGWEEIEAVTRLLEARQLSMGDEVAAFEREAAAVVDREHAVAVCNGTVALDLALKVLSIGPGDEVLVSSLSFIATTNSILWQRATPVFCDVNPDTLNVDPNDVERRVSDRTRALLVADYCGAPADYERLAAICEQAGIALVVDGAQSICSSYRGTPACAFGVVATTSFHTAKPVLTGEGGMLFTDDDQLAEHARRLRGQGEIPGRKYVHDRLAWNYRMTDLAASLGRVQLRRLETIRQRRNEVADRYTELLRDVEGARPVLPLAHTESTWFSYPVRLAARDAVAAHLAERGIETRSLYPIPAYRQPAPEYAAFAGEHRPHAERAAAEILNLPIFFEMTAAEVEAVAEALVEALRVHANESVSADAEDEGRARASRVRG